MKLIIVSGGTGGHIYPGIAIAEEIKRRDPAASILFLGSEEGLEREIVPIEGFPIRLIKARALLRKLSYQALSAPFLSIIGFFQSLRILRSFSPDLVISTGGYVSLPVVIAARSLGIPVVLHEQNVMPGIVNRFCRIFAKEVFLSFPESLKFITGEVVGNPVRREIIAADREKSRGGRGSGGREKTVLIMGGSQGSRKINETVIASIDQLPRGINLIHIIGNRDFSWASRLLADKKLGNYKPLPYLHDMGKMLASADLVISRAGATAIAEFLATGLPMVLIPFPFAADDHQRMNAHAIARHGGAVVIEDRDFSVSKFLSIINDPALDYDKMSKACRGIARPDAAERIVDLIYA